MPGKLLSILTPTIPSRKKQFNKLYYEVHRQIDFCTEFHHTLGIVEMLVDNSRAYLDGGPSIGEKRQNLIDRSYSKYLCFLDDDESIAPNYVETLLRLCQEDKDVCTFRNITKLDNFWCVVDMSIENENEQVQDSEIVYRKPWHVCPVKTEFAKLYKFKNINYGEDWDWFSQVLTHCETEAKTNSLIHGYNHSVNKSEADRIVRS